METSGVRQPEECKVMLFCAMSRGVFRGQSLLGHLNLSLNYRYHSLACAEGDVSLPPTADLPMCIF